MVDWRGDPSSSARIVRLKIVSPVSLSSSLSPLSSPVGSTNKNSAFPAGTNRKRI